MNKHLLVVDDNLKIRKLLRLFFERKYRISEAENGADALTLLSRDDSIDLVLTDINMPVMSGMELIEEMEKKGMEKPVCVLSGTLDKTLINKLQGLGCAAFFDKPFKSQELVQKIDDMFSIA